MSIRWLLTILPLVAASCSEFGARIEWTNGDVKLVGSLILPEGDGPHPLVVFVQGSGCVARDHASNRAHSARLAEMKLASFVYDKRGCGESSGDWKTVDFEPLKQDLLAVLDRLAADPRIDERRIGVMGLSQGAWVSLLAAERSDRIGFLVWLSGPPITPAQQGTAIVEMRLRRKGFDEGAIGEAVALAMPTSARSAEPRTAPRTWTAWRLRGAS